MYEVWSVRMLSLTLRNGMFNMAGIGVSGSVNLTVS